MQLMQAFVKQRATRKFTDRRVPHERIEQLICATSLVQTLFIASHHGEAGQRETAVVGIRLAFTESVHFLSRLHQLPDSRHE
jgi:hypothetical protein